MLDFLFEILVRSVLRWLIIILATPIVLCLAAPFVLVRAWVLAWRRKQRFKYAVEDGFGAVWDYLFSAVTGSF